VPDTTPNPGGFMKKNIFLMTNVIILTFMILLSNIGTTKVSATQSNLIKNISIDKNIVSPGDTINLAIEFNEVDPTISAITVTYVNRDFNAQIDKNLTLNLNNNTYTGSLQLSPTDVKGNWRISTIMYGNTRIYNSNSYSSDNLILSNLKNGDFLLDSLNETQAAISYLSVDKKVTKCGEEVNLEVGIIAKALELEDSATVTYVTPSKISREITVKLNGDKYEGTIPIGAYDENGISKIIRIIINSTSGSTLQIYNSNLNYSNAVDLSDGDFEITNNTDGISPRLLSVKLDKKLVSNNQVVNISVNAKDYISNLSNYSYVVYNKPDGTTRYIDLNLVDGVYEGKINISSTEDIGKWNIQFIAIRNNSGYEGITYTDSSETNNELLIDGDFTVLRSSDLDNDTIVDIKDLAEEATHYNMNNTNVNWIEKYDMNFDNVADLYDLVIISRNMSK